MQPVSSVLCLFKKLLDRQLLRIADKFEGNKMAVLKVRLNPFKEGAESWVRFLFKVVADKELKRIIFVSARRGLLVELRLDLTFGAMRGSSTK